MKKISQETYSYHLPEERIARYPVTPRDHAKLLLYKKESITDHRFYELPDLLSPPTIMIFNDTKVIPARLYFHTTHGAQIEVLLLEQLEEPALWQCMVGNLKKWKEGIVLKAEKTHAGKQLILEAVLVNKSPSVVRFCWNDTQHDFSEILALMGAMPIPPYLKRDADETDKNNYQTIYAQQEGAVAAPTAGLHFTQEVLKKLEEREISRYFLTLHVGAGTFLPVKTPNDVMQHPMHAERFFIPLDTLQALQYEDRQIIAVGTTTARALESAYWAGIKVLLQLPNIYHIEKLLPYELKLSSLPTLHESLHALSEHLHRSNINGFHASTQLMILPGYRFQTINGLITNFHQPGSTLIMMIAAFVGDDWTHIYQHALQNNYRFLSYGDASLLIP